MNNKKYRQRILLTILCGLLAYCTFNLQPTSQSIAIKVSPEKTISTTHANGVKFFEWLGIVFLALSVWIWRRELKLTGFGPFSGESLEEQTSEDFRKDESDSNATTNDLLDVEKILSKRRYEEPGANKQRILDLLKKRHKISSKMVANDLGFSPRAARALLYALMHDGKIRSDGNPRSSLYTLTTSPENLALDYIRSLIQEEHPLESERRFVRVKHSHEIDGVFETRNSKYLAEIRYVQQKITPSSLDQWLNRFLACAKYFNAESIILFLALVVFEDGLISPVEEIVERFTYDAGEMDIRILVLSRTKLENAHNRLAEELSPTAPNP